jgi:hypothetical protein
MEYTLSRIIEDLSRIIEDAIRRFVVAWKLKRPKNDDDPDFAYIAQIPLIIIIVAIIAGILVRVLYPK